MQANKRRKTVQQSSQDYRIEVEKQLEACEKGHKRLTAWYFVASGDKLMEVRTPPGSPIPKLTPIEQKDHVFWRERRDFFVRAARNHLNLPSEFPKSVRGQ